MRCWASHGSPLVRLTEVTGVSPASGHQSFHAFAPRAAVTQPWEHRGKGTLLDGPAHAPCTHSPRRLEIQAT